MSFFWWTEVDSNHRSLRRQIYSLIHLAALESVRMVPQGGIEPPTEGFSVPCSTNWAIEACLPSKISFRKADNLWRPKRGSNSWPPAWQAGALTKLSYWAVLFKYIKLLVGLHGFEPRTNRLWADSSDHWAKGPHHATLEVTMVIT